MMIIHLPLDHPLTRFALAGTLAASLAGCAPNLAASSPETDTQKNSQTETSTKSGEVTTTTVDADSAKKGNWAYFSFSEGKVVTPADAATSTDWDIAFQGTNIKSNGGINGTGGVTVARLVDQDFEALTQAPGSGYVADAADSDDAGSAQDTGFLINGGWYDYNSTTHVVTVKTNVVFVIKATSGKYFKFKATKYYDDAGTARIVTFMWAEITAPTTTASL